MLFCALSQRRLTRNVYAFTCTRPDLTLWCPSCHGASPVCCVLLMCCPECVLSVLSCVLCPVCDMPFDVTVMCCVAVCCTALCPIVHAIDDVDVCASLDHRRLKLIGVQVLLGEVGLLFSQLLDGISSSSSAARALSALISTRRASTSAQLWPCVLAAVTATPWNPCLGHRSEVACGWQSGGKATP